MADPPSGEDFADPILKTLTWRGKRTSLRLEKAIWDGIAWLARSRSIPARRYLEQALADSDSAGAPNRSAFIRARVASELLQEAMQDRLDLADLRSMVRAAPSPVFVLNSRGELCDYNDEMAHFIRVAFEGRPANPTAKLELQFARPLAVIEQELEDARGALALVNFSLSYDGAIVPGRARLTVTGPRRTMMRRLVGFIQQ
jgi:predicted DNA-binding ribbon-helix-helix protein